MSAHVHRHHHRHLDAPGKKRGGDGDGDGDGDRGSSSEGVAGRGERGGRREGQGGGQGRGVSAKQHEPFDAYLQALSERRAEKKQSRLLEQQEKGSVCREMGREAGRQKRGQQV